MHGFSYSSWLRVGAALFVFVVGHANAQPVVSPWIDFTEPPISPVAREVDSIMIAPGGTLTSGGVSHLVAIREDADSPRHAQWTASLEPGQKNGWASIGLSLPRRVGSGVVGMQIELAVPQPIELEFQAYSKTGTHLNTNFFRGKRLGKQTQTFKSGRHTIELIWRDMGVDEPEAITGLRVIRKEMVSPVRFERIDLLFQDEESAAEFQRDEQSRLRDLRQTMQRWITDRGINLEPWRGRTESDEWEEIAWQAVQVLAMEQQIQTWACLYDAVNGQEDNEASQLEAQRMRLQQRLRSARPLHGAVLDLQQAVDEYVDRRMNEFTIEQRRFRLGEDRFYRPDGRAFRMFGPHFFRSIYEPERSSLLWRPWDLRYYAGLGFNGLRLQVIWKRLEPTRGEFDPNYLAEMKAICREAERYGLAVSIDLHWPFPQWFREGKPGYGLKGNISARPMRQNAYHWPEALIDSWGRFASVMAEHPNILAWEVPANEPTMASGPGGISDYPYLVELWNQWLKHTYESREQLAAAWGQGEAEDRGYALQPDESWDDNTIRPLGYQGDLDPNEAFARNPRLWDHLRWTAWMQRDLTERCMTAIRESVPGAVGMMQRTIGDRYDESPVPLDYHDMVMARGSFVLPGTHYGMGSINARKVSSVTYASYDSEQQMENNRKNLRQHVRWGLGVCPFAFHARGGGGMLFADDAWHLKPSVAYLPGESEWVRNHWPDRDEDLDTPRVAVVLNNRLAAVGADRTGQLIEMLEAQSARVAVFEGLQVVLQPGLLEDYDLVVTSASYMDPKLLAVLDTDYSGQILLTGRLDIDSYARSGSHGLAAELVERGLFVNDSQFERLTSTAAGRIDLTGQWQWHFLGDEMPDAVRFPPASLPEQWGNAQVPDLWGDREIVASGDYFLGDVWQRMSVEIPASWEGQTVRLVMGAIDDYDWTYFNSQSIGQTPPGVADAHLVKRDYLIRPELIQWGQANTIDIIIRNTFNDGGIWRGPVELVTELQTRAAWTDAVESEAVVVGMDVPLLKLDELHASAHVEAGLTLGAERYPAVLQQGRWRWWIGDTSWDRQSGFQTELIERCVNSVDASAQ